MRVGAPRDAASAENALGCVADEARSQLVDVSLRVNALILAFLGARDLGNMEQLAVAVLVALLAVLVVVGKKELHASSSGFYCLRGGDADLHALIYRIDAARHEPSRAGRLDKADAAGALVALAVVVCTQRRNFISAGLRGFEDGEALFHLIGNTFNLDIDL